LAGLVAAGRLDPAVGLVNTWTHLRDALTAWPNGAFPARPCSPSPNTSLTYPMRLTHLTALYAAARSLQVDGEGADPDDLPGLRSTLLADNTPGPISSSTVMTMPPGVVQPAAVEQICRVSAMRARAAARGHLAWPGWLAPGTGIWPGDTAVSQLRRDSA